MHTQTFYFYGTGLYFKSDSMDLAEEIRRDFSFFNQELKSRGITINAYLASPPYASLPAMVADYISVRNICYYHRGIKYIDYPGKALAIYNKKESTCSIYGSDFRLLHEICYLTVLSLVNEHLDKKHIHRVHGLGLSMEGKAILLLLDMGGGKTTLAMRVLSGGERVKLISEDSPLINPQGLILPFPIRMGLQPKDLPTDIPKQYQRYFERGEFGPKILLDIEYFKDKVCHTPSEPRLVLICKRTLGLNAQIRPCGKFAAVKEFIKNSVVGVGLYQGIEYVFKKGPKEIIMKTPLGISRLNNAVKVINKSKIFEFHLSPDKEANVRTLIDFLNGEFK